MSLFGSVSVVLAGAIWSNRRVLKQEIRAGMCTHVGRRTNYNSTAPQWAKDCLSPLCRQGHVWRLLEADGSIDELNGLSTAGNRTHVSRWMCLISKGDEPDRSNLLHPVCRDIRAANAPLDLAIKFNSKTGTCLNTFNNEMEHINVNYTFCGLKCHSFSRL